MVDPRMAAAQGSARQQPYQAPSRQQMAATQPAEHPQRGHQPRAQQLPAAPERRRKGGRWKVVLQFVLGLVVIAVVALAIVALYVRYYQ